MKEKGVLEHSVCVHVDRLSQGVYLATSEEVQGLVAQGGTVQETLDIARDVARRLIEAGVCPKATPLRRACKGFGYRLIVTI